ncbi:hypothetical protein L873DRAFT_979082 [Choiromyces venosus 120613-1]|uniref:Uncharacterized protein n=1 Tax=Choiromyces venosus 120613-1 TaxID=1336337 RepID=A0A3N4IWD7_9PEZI|nr:hypothetical protein L873DRAFT_979082 [Choiromyces venosus 120613-1]
MALAPHGQRGHDYFAPATLSDCYRSGIHAVILRFYAVKVKTFRMQGSLRNTTSWAWWNVDVRRDNDLCLSAQNTV